MKIATITTMLCIAAVFMLPFLANAQPINDMGIPPIDAGTEAFEVIEAAPDVTAPPAEDALAIGAEIISAAKAGNWKLLIAGVLSLLMTLAYKFKIRQWKIFAGDRRGAILVMGLALAGAFAAALTTGVAIDLSLIAGAVGVAFTAVGGWTWFKRLTKPRDKYDVNSKAG